jgi:hypothetical protein
MMKRRVVMTVAAAGVLAVASLITQIGNPKKASAQSGCTLQDAQGAYAVQLTGYVPGEAGLAPFVEGGRWVADTRGNFKGSSVMSVGGHYFEHSFTGTVTVNPDCTGRAHVESSLGWPNLNVHWVITNPGQEILLTGLVPGSATNGRAVRLATFR